eukprot:PITA_36569
MFLAFKASVEKQSGHQILKLRSNNGREYVNNKFINFCTENGIQMQHTVPYTPQQNSVAERKNHTLKEMANCMLQSKGLSLNFWAEAISCANYMINHTPTKVLKNITLEEACSSIKPEPSSADVPPLSTPSTSENISSSDDDTKDDNPPPPSQDPPSPPQLPKWVRATRDAAGHPDWDTAMNEEYRSLLTNDTWDLVPLPKGRKLVRCKWVYRTKYGPDGKVDKHKARLVAKGFSQVEGINYTDTFSLLPK